MVGQNRSRQWFVPVPSEIHKIPISGWPSDLQRLVRKLNVMCPVDPCDLYQWGVICHELVREYNVDCEVVQEFRHALTHPTIVPTEKPVAEAPKSLREEVEHSFMAKVNNQMQTIINRVDKLESGLEKLNNDVKAVEDKVNTLNDDVKIISCSAQEPDTVARTSNPTAEVSACPTAQDIDAEPHLAHPSLPAIKEVQSNSFVDLNKRLDSLTDKFNIATTLLDRLDHKVDRVDAKTDRYDIKVDQVSIQLGSLTQQHTIHSGLLEQAKIQGHTLGGEIRKLEDRISVLQEDKTKIAESEKGIIDWKTKQIQGEHDRVGIKFRLSDLKDRLENFIEQVNVRKMNRVLLGTPKWARDVPNLDGHTNINKTSHINGKWGLWDPSVIKGMSVKDLDRWLEFYGIGQDCKDFHFLRDVSKQVKQALLFNFIGGTSANPSFFK